MSHKRMFKVISPIKRNDGSTFWMRVGTAFVNKDESINVYIDALPLQGRDTTLQLRELTEEELRERESKREHFSNRVPPVAPVAPGMSQSLPF